MIVVGGFRPMPKPEKQEKKQPGFIKQKSKKQQKKDTKYLKERLVYIHQKPCAICSSQATEVHHKKGRQGYADEWARQREVSLLHDQRFWLPLCHDCHSWVETHPIEAKTKGYSETRRDVIVT